MDIIDKIHKARFKLNSENIQPKSLVFTNEALRSIRRNFEPYIAYHSVPPSDRKITFMGFNVVIDDTIQDFEFK
jgi:hypothetical protein